MAEKSKSKGSDKKVHENLDQIKKDLDELRAKLGMTKRGDFTRLQLDVAKKVGETTSEIIKKASDVFEKALKVAQYSALGALEGGKRAFKEGKRKPEKKKS